MLFKDACNLVFARSSFPGVGEKGLRVLLAKLGSPHAQFKIVHVAGTNGKGSVCTLLAGALSSSGKKTGLFVSPHLISPAERICIDGKFISKRTFSRLVQEVRTAETTPLNFFEFLTVVAFLYFARERVAYAVLETGLGGRKDPTNVCSPVASVITSIGLDHTQLLGNTVSQIAKEKAGIIKQNVPVFCGDMVPQALRVIEKESRAKNAPLTVVKAGNPFTLKRIDFSKKQLLLTGPRTTWPLALLGEKQVQNACLVFHVAQCLGVPQKDIQKAFKKTVVPGRFEVIKKGKTTFILDGAHNPQAIENLIAFYQKTPFYKKSTLLCGFMKDKDFTEMLTRLAPHFARIILTVAPSGRAAQEKDLKAWLSAPNITFVPHLNKALKKAAQNPVVLCSGSFYLVGAVRKKLV